MRYKAEYIWIDGTRPTAKLRSKTKILTDGAEPPIWGFDGSSTNQAEGHASDRVLKPVASFPDPIRGRGDVLVMCEVYHTHDTAHESNTRAARGKHAVAAGCRWLVAETGEPAEGAVNPSLNNLVRAGLQPRYARRNWVWHSGGSV